MSKRKEERPPQGRPGSSREPAPRRSFLPEVAGLGLVVLALLTLLSLATDAAGIWGAWWRRTLFALLGWGAYPAALGLGAAGVLLLLRQLREGAEPPWDRVLGAELVFLAALGMSHLALRAQDPLAAAREGRGGGLVGWAFSHFLAQHLGAVPTWALLLALALTGLHFLTRISPRALWAEVAGRV
ncbi:MAG: DNA translocase FtsK 4TM domain-containing protein, partial [Anaerolineae bacterium]